MRDHFGPRATLQRGVGDLMEGLRRVPRLIDSLHLIAERERQRVERVAAQSTRRSTLDPRVGFAEIIAVLALIAAALAWWR